MTDPLLDLVQKYRQSLAIFDASPASEGSPEHEELEAAWSEPYERLCENPPKATSFEGAVAGIHLVADEEEHCGHQRSLTINVLRAALAFFDGRNGAVS